MSYIATIKYTFLSLIVILKNISLLWPSNYTAAFWCILQLFAKSAVSTSFKQSNFSFTIWTNKPNEPNESTNRTEYVSMYGILKAYKTSIHSLQHLYFVFVQELLGHLFLSYNPYLHRVPAISSARNNVRLCESVQLDGCNLNEMTLSKIICEATYASMLSFFSVSFIS